MPGDPALAIADYCREVESYLCRKNDGHLVRIVGPSFERVCAWAARGVPLRVACRGIDRYFERYYAKGPRRRPVHVDFCEADVLDVFDEWRRALGVSPAVPADDGVEGGTRADAGPDQRRRESLPAHLERVIARLTAARSGARGLRGHQAGPTFDEVLDAATRELDAARAGAKGLRGEARAAFLARLTNIDASLLAAARASLDEATLGDLRAEAEAELAPFKARMAPQAYERSLAVCTDRLIRERVRLPVIVMD